MRSLWRYNRRPLLIAGALLAALLIVTLTAALTSRLAGPHSRDAATSHTRTGALDGSASLPPSTSPHPPPSDVSYWNDLPVVRPAVSPAYPAIASRAASDPTTYARAFVTELLTQDYARSSRSQLVAWAQWEDSPLRSPSYPQQDWSKALVDSLTDLSWDSATATPVPAQGQWLGLSAERGSQSVSDVRVSLDPIWERYIDAGNQPPDPLATARDVTATVTLRTTVARRVTTSTYSVGLVVQLGSSPRHGGYAMAITNDYVIKKVR